MIHDVEYMKQVRNQPGIRGKLILYYHDAEKLTPYQMLNESCTKAGLDLHLKKTGQINGSLYEHAIVIGDETIVKDFAENNKTAREILAPKALKILEETCYVVTMKNELIGQNIRKWELEHNFNEFNLSTESKIYKLLESYANSSVIHKLIFHKDFNQIERKIINEAANKLKLKSKILDKTQKSVLVVTKKLTLWEIVEYLVTHRYSGSNYEIKVPTNVKISNELSINSNLENQSRKRNYDSITSEHPQDLIRNNNNNILPIDSNLYNQYSITEHYNLQQQYEKLEKHKKTMSLSDLYLLNRVKQQNGCRGKLILFQNSVGDLSHYQMIVESAQKSQLEVLVKKTGKMKENLIEFALEISNEEIIKDFAENNKQAKDILGQKAWNLLQQYCFTIMVKTLLKGRQVDRKEIDNLNLDNEDKNICFGKKNAKIIKLMGLTKSFDTDTEIKNYPIDVQENLRHLGFNFSKENNLEEFQKKIIKYLENYVINPCTYNLVFFNQYSINERKIIFEASLKLKLKAKSFGKEEDRKIVISKKISPWETVENLLARGDENPNYQLKRPTNIMLYNYFYS